MSGNESRYAKPVIGILEKLDGLAQLRRAALDMGHAEDAEMLGNCIVWALRELRQISPEIADYVVGLVKTEIAGRLH